MLPAELVARRSSVDTCVLSRANRLSRLGRVALITFLLEDPPRVFLSGQNASEQIAAAMGASSTQGRRLVYQISSSTSSSTPSRSSVCVCMRSIKRSKSELLEVAEDTT